MVPIVEMMEIDRGVSGWERRERGASWWIAHDAFIATVHIYLTWQWQSLGVTLYVKNESSQIHNYVSV
jgi:hypothetical protein